jgi:hypothetical protein
MALSVPAGLCATLWLATAMLVPACGKGIFDRFMDADILDANVIEDADTTPDSANPGPDIGADTGDTGTATPPDASQDLSSDAAPDGTLTIEQTFADTGGSLDLVEAHLTIGAGTFSAAAPVTVTLRRIPTIKHLGAVGPVFEISVPQSGLFRQDATLTIDISQPVATAVGANLPNLVLGTLNPNATVTTQQWVQVSGSTFDPGTPSVSGLVTGFGNVADLQFAAVIKCPPITACPSGQNCSAGGVCNECPTGSLCP